MVDHGHAGDGEHRHAVGKQADEDAAHGVAGGEISGPVNGVDHPGEFPAVTAVFLPQHWYAGFVDESAAEVLFDGKVDIRGELAGGLHVGGVGPQPINEHAFDVGEDGERDAVELPGIGHSSANASGRVNRPS